MPRPNKPHWHERNRCWRCIIGGKPIDFPREIGQHEAPLIAGVPKRAWDWLASWKLRLAQGAKDARDPTVHAICQLYLQWAAGEVEAKPPRMASANYRGHEAHLIKFCDWTPPGEKEKPYGQRRAASMHPEDLKKFAEAVMTAPRESKSKEASKPRRCSPHYVANLCKSVQAAFNWATRRVKGREPEQYLTTNPFHGYRPPKPPKQADRYLEPSLLRAFLRWAWSRARRGGELQSRSDLIFVRLLWFLALTGARPGEACSARWENVNWRNNLIVLEEWKNKRKTGRNREIHLTAAVKRLLCRLERLPGRHPEWIFTHRRGKGQGETEGATEGVPWNSVALAAKVRKWRAEIAAEKDDDGNLKYPIVEKGAGRLVAYILRHTYISDGLMAGISEAEIGDLTGTSAQMVADTYGHIQRQHAARRAAELAERRRKDG